LICGVIGHSSADGFGNIVTDKRWFDIAIDQSLGCPRATAYMVDRCKVLSIVSVAAFGQ
jgi:hypothetical protein